jgi:hypothetical protein
LLHLRHNNNRNPPRQAEFDMLFGTGIDRRGEVLDLGVKVGLVGKSGSWFSLKETEALKDAFNEWPVLMGQGRDKVGGQWHPGGRACANSSGHDGCPGSGPL